VSRLSCRIGWKKQHSRAKTYTIATTGSVAFLQSLVCLLSVSLSEVVIVAVQVCKKGLQLAPSIVYFARAEMLAGCSRLLPAAPLLLLMRSHTGHEAAFQG